MIDSSSSYHPENYHPENYHSATVTAHSTNISKKARFFANMVSLIWFYYGIGTWYGSKFIFDENQTGPDPGIVLGATFAVWFIAFFASVSYHLIKKPR